MPTRQIAWNVGEFALATMYALVLLQALLLAYGGTRRYLMWRRGKPYGPITGVGDRLRNVLAVAFLHRRLIRPGYRYAGVMHLFIFWGFLALFIGTLIVLLEADIARPYFGVSFYQGAFYVAYKLVINLFGLLFVVGLLMAVWRRYGQHLPKFRRSLTDDALVLGLLLWLGLTGFLLEALRLAATHDPAASVHAATWWLHMLSNTVLLCYIPFSKLLHMFTGPANVFMRAPEPAWSTASIENLEEQEHFGADKLADFSWKQLLN